MNRFLLSFEPLWSRIIWCVCLVSQSYPTLCDPMNYSLLGSSVSGDSPGKNTGVGCHALLQGIFPTQGSNLGLLHCRQILYWLNHQRSPRIQESVAYAFSRWSSWPRNRAMISCIADGFFTSRATSEAPYWTSVSSYRKWSSYHNVTESL